MRLSFFLARVFKAGTLIWQMLSSGVAGVGSPLSTFRFSLFFTFGSSASQSLSLLCRSCWSLREGAA